MATFFLPDSTSATLQSAEISEISGEDVKFGSGMEIGTGDWKVVRGSDAAEQSVRRESVANPGSLMRRPEWGIGATQTIFKSLTRSLSDELVTRARRRMLANPRVGRFISAETTKSTSGLGMSLSLNYEPVGVQKAILTVLKGSR